MGSGSVTLELGGKSTRVIADEYPLDKAAARILLGKGVNAGQTCIAPDYVLISRHRQQAFVEAWTKAVSQRYPTLADNPDVTWIVNERHFNRIQALIEDARAKGAQVLQINPAQETIPAGKRIIPMTVITEVSDDMRVMQEEIFGPILPIRAVDSMPEALAYVKDRPRPLALYYFDEDRARAEQVMTETISGGACVNDTVVHLANFNMPFGGSGDSGAGAYHGFWGFSEFSHKKSVQFQSRWFSPGEWSPSPIPPRPTTTWNGQWDSSAANQRGSRPIFSVHSRGSAHPHGSGVPFFSLTAGAAGQLQLRPAAGCNRAAAGFHAAVLPGCSRRFRFPGRTRRS